MRPVARIGLYWGCLGAGVKAIEANSGKVWRGRMKWLCCRAGVYFASVSRFLAAKDPMRESSTCLAKILHHVVVGPQRSGYRFGLRVGRRVGLLGPGGAWNSRQQYGHSTNC